MTYVPPYLSAIAFIPIAFMASIHFCWLHSESVQSGIYSKPLEFDGVKLRTIQNFPYSEGFYRVSIPRPVCYNSILVVAILLLCDVRYSDVINPIFMDSLDCLVLDCYFSHSFGAFSLAFKLFYTNRMFSLETQDVKANKES